MLAVTSGTFKIALAVNHTCTSRELINPLKRFILIQFKKCGKTLKSTQLYKITLLQIEAVSVLIRLQCLSLWAQIANLCDPKREI
ncbi:hypothetical protein FBFR_09875 [Flavobacterium fryxellicola]|uniref:Uncharacterized protein n=1 Tax=Flavobacterium fryxellicola TaxID=249352 RepID=A0A167X9K5_9FLAO|nr:hypothetical protein FBFR_09875 [Flavobacterium fryxellicola]